MKFRYKRKITVFLFSVCCIAGFFYLTLAQTDEELGISTGVQISPARLDWDLKSGEEKIGTVNLKNFSDKPFDVEIEVEDFYVSDDSSEARFFIPDENHPLKAYDVINWVELTSGRTIHLEPKVGKDIMFKVKVPEGMPTGGYYGALFFRSAVSDNTFSYTNGEESRIKINQRVGMLLVMAVKGKEPIQRQGEVVSFEPDKKLFIQSPAELIAEVKNSGNLHYKALGKIDIYKFGRKLKTLELTPLILYPERTRKYQEKWDFSNWSYGFYKAKLQMASEDNEIQMAAETTFWVIPWKTTLSIVILLVIIWLIFRIFTSKFEIKRKEDSQKESESKVNTEKESEKSDKS